VIELNKEAYYLALRQTQGSIRTDAPNWQPWLVFFLRSLAEQVRRLEKKVEREKIVLTALPELSLQIVEFARELELQGRTPVQAVVESCRLRLRPILMTSIAFIAGVIPLVFSSGAGAEMRQAIGIAVMSGMIGVTVFGLVLTPVFYALLRRLWPAKLRHAGRAETAVATAAGDDHA
jgi:hypothetical protein